MNNNNQNIYGQNYQQVPQLDYYGQPIQQQNPNQMNCQPNYGAYQQPYQYPQQPAMVHEQAYVEPIKPVQIDGQEVSDKMKFVRKVYSILAVQLSLTAAFVVISQTSGFKTFLINNIGLTLGCCVLEIVVVIALICCFGRTHPINLILLGVFTLCESYMVAGLTAQYDKETVILAGLGTALVTVSLTFYAMTTKVEIQVFQALIWVIYLAMMPLIIIGFVIRTKGLNILYCCLGLIFYSLFLIIDTMMICNSNKSAGGMEISYDDYVLCALNLYLDIIMIFVYILKLLGNKD